MMSAVRASKRLAIGGVLSFCLVLFSLLAVKDMSDKLGVMTASNDGYQKMTDSQAAKIKMLTSELDDLRAAKDGQLKEAGEHELQLQTKVKRLESEIITLKRDLKSSQDKFAGVSVAKQHLEAELDELRRSLERQRTNATRLAIQNHNEKSKLTSDHELCKKQYSALFKMYQNATDIIQTLTSKSTVKAAFPAGNVIPPKVMDKSSLAPARLEQPNLKNPPLLSSSTSSSQKPINLDAPPVNDVKHQAVQPRVVEQPAKVYRVSKEDVMEAPRVDNNLDAEVDPVQQEHPGLNGQFDGEEDEDEMEDPADGQISHDYQVVDPPVGHLKGSGLAHKDDIDYDFQDAFHPPQRVRQPHQQVFRQHPNLVVQNADHRVQYVPQYPGGQNVRPYMRGRGL